MCAAMRRGFTALLIFTSVYLSSVCLAQDDPGRDDPPPDGRTEYGVLRSGPLDFDDDFVKYLGETRRGEIVELRLFDDLSIFPETVSVRPTRIGFDWVGRIPGKGVGHVMFSVAKGSLVGTVWLETAIFNIHRDGRGGYAVEQVDPGAFTAIHESEFEQELKGRIIPFKRLEKPKVVANKIRQASVYNRHYARLERLVQIGLVPERVMTRLPEPGSRVDLLIAITPEAQRWLADNGGSNASFSNLILKANLSLSESGIATQLNLLGVAYVFYKEASDKTLKKDRKNLRGPPVDSDLQDLHTLRDLLRADIVSLLVRHPPEEGRNCGRSVRLKAPAANLNPAAANGPFDSVGFNVVNIDCAVMGQSLTHEIAHNFGAAHDNYRFQKEVAAGLAQNPKVFVTPAMPGAHGHFPLGQNVRTIMAYPDFCIDIFGQAPWDPANPEDAPCPIIPWFSTPQYTYGGAPLGTYYLMPANNAAVMNLTAQTVANFRHAYFP
jgi:hypothetical protein